MQALSSERFTGTIKQVHEKSKTEFLNNELEFLKGRDNNKLMLKSDQIAKLNEENRIKAIEESPLQFYLHTS